MNIRPSDILGPSACSRWPSFRAAQTAAMDWLYFSESRVSAALLQTGSGKTLIGISLGRLIGGRTIYLVATKALEQQVMDDFSQFGMVCIHGRANYTCERYDNCDRGAEEKCSLAGTHRCPYTYAVEAAKASSMVVTNYSYWLHARGASDQALISDDGEDFSLLVCDEAHGIEAQVTDHSSITISRWMIGRPMAQMSQLAGQVGESGAMPNPDLTKFFTPILSGLSQSKDKDDKELAANIRKILRMTGNWVYQFNDTKTSVTFSPVSVRPFVSRIFGSIPRVLLMSASLDEFTCRMIIPKDQTYDYRAWDSVFNPGHAPVYHIPTVRVTRKSTDLDYETLTNTADSIIDSRTDRNGIVHTVSYDRSRRYARNSRHSGRIVTNDDSSSLRRALEQFRNGRRGSILVTPSVEEGYSFEGVQAEYQIILKFPFPNEGQAVIRARCRSILGYRLHYAIQKLVQMRGRPWRSPTDRVETFILDNAVKQVFSQEAKAFLPPGFKVFSVNKIPSPPPRLEVKQTSDTEISEKDKDVTELCHE